MKEKAFENIVGKIENTVKSLYLEVHKNFIL